MPFSTLLQQLHGLSIEEREAARETMGERVHYPSGWEIDHDSTKLHRPYGEDGNWQLRLSVHIDRGPAVKELITKLLERVQQREFRADAYAVQVDVQWTVEELLQEVSTLPVPEIKMRASLYTRSPEHQRGPSLEHSLEAEFLTRELTVSAMREYRALLPGIVQELQPQQAVLSLTPADVIGCHKWLKTLGWGKGKIKKALEPQLVPHLRISADGTVSTPLEEVIQLAIPTEAVESLAQTLGKSLLVQPTTETSGIVAYRKYFSRYEEGLPALQIIARQLEKFQPTVLLNQPLITEDEARVSLDQEIKEVCEEYAKPGLTDWKWAESMLRRLVDDHFSFEARKALFDAEEAERLALFAKAGYTYQPTVVIPSSGDEWWLNVPHMRRAHQLLEYFLWSFRKDPGTSVEKFREFFINRPQSVSIRGTSKWRAEISQRIFLPKHSQLWGVKVQPLDGDDNEVVLDGFSNVHFWIRAAVESPELVDLQDWLCNELGVKFQ